MFLFSLTMCYLDFSSRAGHHFADQDSKPDDFSKNVALLIAIIRENIAAYGKDHGASWAPRPSDKRLWCTGARRTAADSKEAIVESFADTTGPCT